MKPKYDAKDIYGIVPSDLREQYDVREIISRLVDIQSLRSLKKNMELL